MAEEIKVIATPQEMWADSEAARAKGARVGLVPTMGALHAGHLSLIKYARENADHVVVSIFVNPLQFDRADDLAAYPRTFQEDMAHCASLGVATIYAPTTGAMYREGFQSRVEVVGLSQGLEGAGRPGHFAGVTTVCTKLFAAVKPHLAVFGQKDFQQLRIIQRMVADLDVDMTVVGRPTVREADGLALSSRNVHLSPEERQQAPCIQRGMQKALAMYRDGNRDVTALVDAVRAEIEGQSLTRIEYVELRDSTDLKPLEHLDRPARMLAAVWLGGTRLIDNLQLE